MKFMNLPRIQFAAVALFGLAVAFAVPARADKVTLVAGGAGADGGPANQAKLSKPFGVIFDKAGNLYIGQFGTKTEGQFVRKVDPKAVSYTHLSLPTNREV